MRLPLVLASGSPQRRALLERLGVPFTVRVSDASELEQGEDPSAVAVENALRKARTAHRPGAAEAVLGCDTIVVLDGTIYGKPGDAGRPRDAHRARRAHPRGAQRRRAAARRRALRGQRADRAGAHTGHVPGARPRSLERYVGTGEWRGRSGGYAIQGAGAALALAIDGEEENVVGLPLDTLRALYPEMLEG